MLYLWLAVLMSMDEELPEKPQVIFFDSGDEFRQVKRFEPWHIKSLMELLRLVCH